MRRYLRSTLLAVIAVILIVVPILAYTYSATILIANANVTNYFDHSFSLTLDNAYLVQNGYSSSYGLDVQTSASGVSVPSMMVSDRTNLAYDLLLTRTDSITMTFGNTPATSMPIVLGYDGYMTTTDAAGLEFGSDFASEIDGYIDTSTAHTLMSKSQAYITSVVSSGVVASAILSEAKSYGGNSVTSTSHIGAGSDTREGIRLNSFSGVITKVVFRLSKENSPTGNGYVRVRSVTDDSILGTIATINVATISASLTQYTYVGVCFVTVPTDIRVMFEYDGGDGSNYIKFGTASGSSIDTTYDGATYTDTASVDCGIVYYDTKYVKATGVTSGEHNIKTYTTPSLIAEESNTVGANNHSEIYGAYESAQTFTPVNSHTVDTVRLELYKVGTDWVGGVDVSITATDGAGKPTGAALCTANVLSSALTNSPTWITFDLGVGTSLTASTMYAIVVSASGANYVDNYLCWSTSPNLYAGGTWVEGDGAGGWTVQTTVDTMFEELYHDIEFALDIDSVTESAILLAGVTVPSNANNWLFYPEPYWNYYKHTVGGVEVAQYKPERIVGNSTYSTGTATFTNGSAIVTGSGTVWTYSMIGSLIKPDADTAYYQIISRTDNTTITLDRVYAPATASGVAYGIVPRIQDETSYTYVATPTWGSNPAGVTLSIGALSSYSNPVPAGGATAVPNDMVTPTVDSAALVRSDAEAKAISDTNLFTPYFQPWSTMTNIPVLVFLLFISTALLIVVVVYVMKYTNNQLVGTFVLIVGEAFLYKVGIFELWFVLVSAFICVALIIFERKPAL